MGPRKRYPSDDNRPPTDKTKTFNPIVKTGFSWFENVVADFDPTLNKRGPYKRKKDRKKEESD